MFTENIYFIEHGEHYSHIALDIVTGLQRRPWHAVCNSNFIFKFKLYQGLPVIEKGQKLVCAALNSRHYIKGKGKDAN